MILELLCQLKFHRESPAYVNTIPFSNYLEEILLEKLIVAQLVKK
jgi:hypothetical protein